MMISIFFYSSAKTAIFPPSQFSPVILVDIFKGIL